MTGPDAPSRPSGSIAAVVPLGLNGFYPSHGRQTMCFLADARGPAGRLGLLLDAGTGVGRLAESSLPLALEDFARLEVLLTHYHLDHVCGLAALPSAYRAGGGSGPIRIWAPTRPLVDADPHEDLHRLIAPPLFPYRLDAFEPRLEVRSYGDATDLDELSDLLGLSIRTRRNVHAGGAVGLRFGNQLAYVTDSAPDSAQALDAGTLGLVRNVHTLMHEVWATAAEAGADRRLLEGHSDTSAVRALSEHAAVERLVPVHHPPQRDGAAIEKLHDELESHAYRLHRPEEATAFWFATSAIEPESARPGP